MCFCEYLQESSLSRCLLQEVFRPPLILSASQDVFEGAPSVVLLWRRELLTLATNGDHGGGGKLRAPLCRAECHRSLIMRLFLLCPYPYPRCVFLGDSVAKVQWTSSPGGWHCADLCYLPCSQSPTCPIPVPCPGLVTSVPGPSPSGLITGPWHCPPAAARWKRDAKAEAVRGVPCHCPSSVARSPWPAPIPGLRVAARTCALVRKELRLRGKAVLGCALWPPLSSDWGCVLGNFLVWEEDE